MAESPHEATLASDTTAATNMISCSACGVEISCDGRILSAL